MEENEKTEQQKMMDLIVQQRNLIINQTNDIRRIKNNVVFLFWMAIIPPIIGLILYFMMAVQSIM